MQLGKYFIPVLLPVMLLGCSTVINTFPTADADKIGVESNKFRGTVFKSSYPEEKLLLYPGLRYKRMKLTKEEVQLAEKIVKQQIRTANSARMNQKIKR